MQIAVLHVELNYRFLLGQVCARRIACVPRNMRAINAQLSLALEHGTGGVCRDVISQTSVSVT
jgi:hypothetical protein